MDDSSPLPVLQSLKIPRVFLRRRARPAGRLDALIDRVVLARALILSTCIACFCLAGCERELGVATRALFDLTGNPQQDLFALPYPIDLRVRADGTIDLARLSHDQPTLIQDYFDRVSANELGGFATNGGAFFRFDGKLATSTLPLSPSESLTTDSSVLMVNIDQASPSFGQRIPITATFVEKGDRYIGDNYLAVLPVAGFPLASRTLYAVIVRDAVRNADRALPLSGGDDFPLLLRDRPPSAERLARAYATYAPLRAYLAKSNITGVAVATLFTTGDPTRVAQMGRDVVLRQPVPRAADMVVNKESERFYEIEGTYQAPNFQQGDPPYSVPSAGGNIKLALDGSPVVARTETLRFALSVPKGVPPADGWPVVLYAHGTGGDYKTFIRNGVARELADVKDEAGATVAKLAVLGIDQVLHGPRAPEGTVVDVAFFNALNPAALVANVIQAALDNVSLRRLAGEIELGQIPWSADSGQHGQIDLGGQRLDNTRVAFFGHSQGGITGPPYIAFDPDLRGAVLSGRVP